MSDVKIAPSPAAASPAENVPSQSSQGLPQTSGAGSSSQGSTDSPSAPSSSQEVPPSDSSQAKSEGADENIGEAEISLMRKILRTKLIESKNNIEIVRNDPKSPLYSVKSFEELRLPEPLLKGLYAMGFQAPSKIQETALPILLANP